MPRNIIIALDGTGNQFGRRNTNIVKICECLRRGDDQIVYYDPGVGTMGDPNALTSIKRTLTRALGGAIGYGLMDNVQQAYDFLAWHYEPGDRIYIFGFSRGAYTARALAAILKMYGLTGPGAGNMTPYLVSMLTEKQTDERQDDKLTPGVGEPRRRSNRWVIANSFKKHFAQEVDIKFLGVFDTVASVGWFWSPLRIPHTTTNSAIECVRHAVAIDERRAFFRPDLFRPDPADPPSKRQSKDLKEVWFAGVHSDVGGGYEHAEQGLAQVALQWMLREAEAKELHLDHEKMPRVLGEKYPEPDAAGPAHNSLTVGWWPLELIPKFGWERVKHREEGQPRWKLGVVWNLFRRRVIPKGATMHASVQQRWDGCKDWRPKNLGDPKPYPVEA